MYPLFPTDVCPNNVIIRDFSFSFDDLCAANMMCLTLIQFCVVRVDPAAIKTINLLIDRLSLYSSNSSEVVKDLIYAVMTVFLFMCYRVKETL